ncbi:DNA mismatch repair protein mutS [Sebaldella termitidis]|uniref:DNA mismatch repair protein MutS n=1 Tax=Sebaldella termitidis (strain ATCC 33386 / NCTC 11300) TaxID=526218 RepID=D1AML4_SEBTE|nr:DNA mismatch repair protein MutS [Sebaldella termitidis]ACZ09588.1 DNA mismatch repair protein MutS [Sebaldella termitidis ATCC 33386]SUI24918.1 DNA mismatch repair protein mutS [Sebaldella termitidis]
MSETPLMKQYREIKENHQDSILFFRLGDFYEMFFQDAVTASKELGLTLTSRNKEKGMDVPLAGIPYHSSASYITKLVNKGYKVAICEQVEDPRTVKGIVKREVVKIVTPGTVIDVDSLDATSNNYLLSVKHLDNKTGIAYLDITTGEFKVLEIEDDSDYSKTFNELYKIEPKEILVEFNFYEALKDKFDDYSKKIDSKVTLVNKLRDPENFLTDYFNIVSLESFGISEAKAAVHAAGMILDYALSMQVDGDLPLEKIEYINITNFAEINSTTRRNLELTRNQREKTSYGTLLWVLDKCKTSMGTRFLKKIINNPLLEIEEIKKRQDDLQYFMDNILIREEIKEKLGEVYDLERLAGKIVLGNENGKDLTALKKSIISSLEIMDFLRETAFFTGIDTKTLTQIRDIIEESIKEDAPFSIREGNIIKRGYNQELDEIFKIMSSGKDYLLEIEAREKERTGIKNLKIKYNKVFGYFLEVSNSNKDLVPEDYIRKQTLSNAERYITEELKEYEDKIINSKSKVEEIEYYLFKEISGKIKEKREVLNKLSEILAYLDVIISFAVTAIENNYVRPEFVDDYVIEIEEGRHPVVEKLIGREDFVSNNVRMDREGNFIILTGPNMAGKSTYMKQIGLIQILAQIGSYVPAQSARLSIVDKILTRIGAADDIVSGQSTFMVEMSEVSNIINSATERSLIILDEVGRGTSTFDGISIATAITEYIHDKIKAKTIFATHYHELTELEEKFDSILNYRIEVEERSNSVVFLRKIVRGGADKSYGIEVARLAGLPKEVLLNSKKILRGLEKRKELIEKTVNVEQLSLFAANDMVEEEKKNLKEDLYEELLFDIENIDINNVTPMEALGLLGELKKKMEEIN